MRAKRLIETSGLRAIRRGTAFGLAMAWLATSACPAAHAQPPRVNPGKAVGVRNALPPGRRNPLSVMPLMPPPCVVGSTLPTQVRTATVSFEFGEVVWQVCVHETFKKNLWIGPVYMFVAPIGWELVIEEAGPAEIFVPYHQNNSRPYLLDGSALVQPVGPTEAGPGGLPVTVDGMGVPTVVWEIRRRGLGWLCKQTSAQTRHAFEGVVWGIAQRGHDVDIIEYGFRDDGVITFRIGSTGYNLAAQPTEPHTHTALWYVNPNTPGAAGTGQSAHWLTHVESAASTNPANAQDVQTPIAVEDARQWNERELATLLIEGGGNNHFGNLRGLEFSPMQNSLARHFGFKEAWTQNDVYLTRARPTELGWVDTWAYPDDYLLTYLNGESIVNQDLAVWIKTSAHHHPNDEDRSVADMNGSTTGITLPRWSGFRIEPHNLFLENPMSGPPRCGP